MDHAPAPRQAAILFADIAGSTKLYETLGDAEALATIAHALDVIRQVCEEHGGRIVKTIGDEAMAIFPNAANAAYASITMQTQVSGMKTSRGAPLAIHAGFHYGPVIDDSKDVFGDSVNLAARLTSLAKSGQTLVTADTVNILSPSLRSRTRTQDTHTVRGKQADIAVFELIWQESREELTAMAPRATAREAMLKVRHGGKEAELGPSVNLYTFGRDAQSDVVIGDRMASRQHARIERRRDKFVLIDHSTNGTYCTVDGEREIELRREEFTLRGRGRISFGHAYAEDPAETVEFESEEAS
ncbi:MAG: adenylate/guanylate cyclase domain-containing protein [Betaproteobacteria bacterium]